MRMSVAALAACLAACSRTPGPASGTSGSASSASSSTAAPGATDGSALGSSAMAGLAIPAGAKKCARATGIDCLDFATPEDAFRWVLARDPRILAVGEAHAQRGTEAIASSTKRFTENFLPILAPLASDVVVELWGPDPTCMKEVKAVASAQATVTAQQASTNQNEYVVLGTKAKAAGMTPWLLKPSCDEFAMLADAGADAIGPMLGLIKKLTQTRVTQLYERNVKAASADGGVPRIVVAYGGALHNDLNPPPETKDYSFGPELSKLVNDKYVELDLIVPEFVQKTPVWEKLPWYTSFIAEQQQGPRKTATFYMLSERSFVLVFPDSATQGVETGAKVRDAGSPK